MHHECKGQGKASLLRLLAQNAQAAGWQLQVTGLGEEEQLRVIL